ncbi:NahK/ErcS family hybrid sensor histidine kinase/response regulator [Aestuariivirga litoralis]|uniref:hybrid sensor histidine kinase/response regulator n=1 Tax=Aestuariivirga litoralis TaxID=2650924 RepID=UPI00315D6638
MTILGAGLAYLGALFAVATWGDRRSRGWTSRAGRPLIYALSLGVYCTSWTYFGSVGIASRTGLDFLPIYLGPILVFALGWKLIQSIATLTKRHNIASIADFLSARYGKSEALGALVTVIAVIGIVPYISIQLKAVAVALGALVSEPQWTRDILTPSTGMDGLSLFVVLTMGIFAILFGTRHIDTTEHQDGMILAIAVESMVKLLAFVAVGAFVVFGMMGGVGPFLQRATADPQVMGLFSGGLDGGQWLTLTLLAAFAVVLLPRQFHVAAVENANAREVKRAAWLFPLYLVAINIFVIPIAVAGLLLLPPGSDGDTFVLALPVHAGSEGFALIAFLGGLSASTAMVIVECIALSIMVCNNLVVPLMLRRQADRATVHQDMGETLILIRRLAIIFVLALAYAYYRMIGASVALAQVGLLSFAAVAQFAPAFFGGLMWKRATARGAMWGITAGFIVWAYTLLLPAFADAGWIGRGFIEEGPWGLSLLKARALFTMEFNTLTHGVVWSLIANVTAYVAGSLTRQPTPIERVQATSFVTRDIQPGSGTGFKLWRTAVTADRLEDTVARYIGADRAHAAFEGFRAQQGQIGVKGGEADVRLIRFAEHLLASAVGVASARLVIALMLERHSTHARGAMKLLDDASAAIQHNRDLLQSAIDNVDQGLAVFEPGMTLICWNSTLQEFLGLGSDLNRVGTPITEVLGAFLARTAAGKGAVDDRVRKIALTQDVFRERRTDTGQVFEFRSSPMPDGGVVVTVIDATESVMAAEELQRVNESLERRVTERTAQLTRLNEELAAAKAEADAANLSKTRFIAAASHDILQPLNAARLFTSTLVERMKRSKDGELVRNVDSSLEAVEEILSALLDISRLDAGAMKAESAPFRIDDILQALALEFGPAARKKGLKFTVVPCGLTLNSDRKLLRRVLQNFVSNAIKYTREGRVLMGCRRHGDLLRIEVHDTGPGIPDSKLEIIFQEFQRLQTDGDGTSGLGLGLSIVERMAKVLETPVHVRSTPGKGSVFAVDVPIASEELRVRVTPKPRKVQPPALAAAVRVLVIDNEQPILEGMELLLSGWGNIVHTATGLEEALAQLAAADGKVDMILADYHLNNEDGISVIRALRTRARRPIPAVLITADRTPAVADLAVAHDVHMLRKPVKPAALRAAMSHVAIRAEAGV